MKTFSSVVGVRIYFVPRRSFHFDFLSFAFVDFFFFRFGGHIVGWPWGPPGKIRGSILVSLPIFESFVGKVFFFFWLLVCKRSS